MSFSRVLVPFIAVAICVGVACGAPPDREIQQALGAIDAARAAGAERYAREVLTAAEQAVDDLLDIEGMDAERAASLIMTARAPWFEETNS